MGYSLKDIRKDAGYKSAREYAEKSGMAVPTYSRYEQMPDKIPLKAAWALADAFDCSIDAIVGRAQPETETVHGSVQQRYDELSPVSQAQIDEYMDFVSGKETDTKKRVAAAEKALYASQAQRYEEMFIRASAATQKASEVVMFGSDEEIREEYRRFVWEILETKRDKEAQDFPGEWLETYCNLITPPLDLHIDSSGYIYGEDEETCATANELIAMAIDKKVGKLMGRYEEVMENIMEAYDSTHKPT